MSVKEDVSLRLCEFCKKPFTLVSMKTPFIDDYETECRTKDCPNEDDGRAMKRLNARARAEAKREL